MSPKLMRVMNTARCATDAAYRTTDACRAEREADAAGAEVARFRECRANMDSILAVASQRDGYVALGPAPRATPTPEAVPWTADAAWSAFGWAPAAPVAGVYWTEVGQAPAGGASFTVHCAIDSDGDGLRAEVEEGPGVAFHRVGSPDAR